MATIIATSSGNIVVGEAGSVPIIEGIIGSVTPTITAQARGEIEVAASTASGALLPTGMTTILFLHLRFFDITDDSAVNVASVTLNTLVVPNVQEILWSSRITADGLTALSFTTAAGSIVRGEFIIAGV